MKKRRGFGVIEVLLVGGLVAGAGMAYKFITDVKDSGKKESELEMHEHNVELREETDEQIKEFDIQQERFNIEDRRMLKRKASPKERNRKALKRWGK